MCGKTQQDTFYLMPSVLFFLLHANPRRIIKRGYVGAGGGQRRPLWPKIGVSSLITSCHLI